MALHESGENYLETILILQNRNGYVRSIDIANELNYTKPSVSRAMSILRNDGYILMEKDGNITLTEKGHKTASAIYERHQLITRFLMMTLDIDESTADADACRIEHILSKKSFAKIKELTNAVEAFKESGSNYSMVNQFLTEPAVITVSEEGIYATVVMHGTKHMHMSSVKTLQYSYDNVTFTEMNFILDAKENTLTFTLPVTDLNRPVYMKVHVSGKMSLIHPKFRLVFKVDSVVE